MHDTAHTTRTATTISIRSSPGLDVPGFPGEYVLVIYPGGN